MFTLDDLYVKLKSNNVTPLWKLEGEILPILPQSKSIAWLWKWDSLYNLAKQSGSLVPIERGGDRRALGISNPGLDGLPYATDTLWLALQWLNGNEVAPSHRHTSQAIRFIIDGQGSYSTVQGDRVFLERGDLVLNPPLLWHDHGSEAEERAVWIDGLDIPLTNYLGASFFEPMEEDIQEVSKVEGGSILKYGVGNLRPAWEEPSVEYPAMSTFKWADTERALVNLEKSRDFSPYDDIALEYINSHSGRPVMKTFTCMIQMIRKGIHTKAHQQVSSAVYYVFEGEGYSVIDGVKYEWQKGDIFVVPVWAIHEHRNTSKSERAILFSIQDIPIMKAVDKYREVPYLENNGHQKITDTFSY